MALKEQFRVDFESKGARKLVDDVKKMQDSFEDLSKGMEKLASGSDVFSFVGQGDMPGLEAMQEKVREAHESLRAIRNHIKKEGLGAEEVRALAMASDELSGRLGEMWSTFADSEFADSKEWRKISDEIFRMADGIEGIKDAKSDLDKVQEGMQSLVGSGDEVKGAFSAIGKQSPLKTFLSSKKALMGFGKSASELGKTMAKSKGITGALGKGLQSLGAVATGSAASVLAVGAAAAGAVVLIMKMTDGVAKFSKQLMEAHGAFELAELSGVSMGKAMTVGDFRKGLRTTRKELLQFRRVLNGLVTEEDTDKAMAAFAKSGVRLADLGEISGGLSQSLLTARTAGIQLGIGFERGADMMGEFITNTGASVSGLRETFASLSREAATSGMSNARFTSTLMNMLGPLGVLDSRIESAAKQLSLFTSTLGAAAGKDAVAEIRKAFSGGYDQLLGQLILIRGGATGGKERIDDILSNAYLDQASVMGKMLQDKTVAEIESMGLSSFMIQLKYAANMTAKEFEKLALKVDVDTWENMPKEMGKEARLLGLKLARIRRTLDKPEKSMEEVAMSLEGVVDPFQMMLNQAQAMNISIKDLTEMNDMVVARIMSRKLAGISPRVLRQIGDTFKIEGVTDMAQAFKALRAEAGTLREMGRADQNATQKILNEVTGSLSKWWHGIGTGLDKAGENATRAAEDVGNKMYNQTNEEIRKAVRGPGAVTNKSSKGTRRDRPNWTLNIYPGAPSELSVSPQELGRAMESMTEETNDALPTKGPL